MPDQHTSGACRCPGHSAPEGNHRPAPGEVHVRILRGASPDAQGRIEFTASWPASDSPTGVRTHLFEGVLADFVRAHDRISSAVVIVNPDHPALAGHPDA